MIDLTPFTTLLRAERNLVVIAIALPDRTVHVSVVNAGVLAHPRTGAAVVGVVAGGRARKLGHLRAHSRATMTARAGWQWAALDGPVELAGPDDPMPGCDSERLRLLLRDIFRAAGGTHDNWDAYDRAMAQERRTAILLSPQRTYGNALERRAINQSLRREPLGFRPSDRTT